MPCAKQHSEERLSQQVRGAADRSHEGVLNRAFPAFPLNRLTGHKKEIAFNTCICAPHFAQYASDQAQLIWLVRYSRHCGRGPY